MGVGVGLPEGAASGLPEHRSDAPVLAIRRLVVDADADDVAQQANPDRGNGFSETIDYAIEQQLVQASSAVEIDIRAASGRVGVHLVGGVTQVKDGLVTVPRRGTWISYTVVTA
jgi:hypothetical protein